MSVTFAGTYTQDSGQQVAAGTVTVTPYQGSPTVGTLDASGHYSVSVTDAGVFQVVEAITGVAAASRSVKAASGATVDTSRDVGPVIGQSGTTVQTVGTIAAPITVSQNAPAGSSIIYASGTCTISVPVAAGTSCVVKTVAGTVAVTIQMVGGGSTLFDGSLVASVGLSTAGQARIVVADGTNGALI